MPGNSAIGEISGPAELDDLIRSEDRDIVLEFWGTWCRPCRVLRPHLERIAQDHADRWRFAAIHVDNNPDLAEAWSVMGTPTLIFLRGGEERRRTVGAITPSMIEDQLSSVV